MKLTTMAIVSAAVLGLTATANAQSGGRVENPELNRGVAGQKGVQPTAPSGSGMQQGTTGSGNQGNSQVHDGTGNAGNTPPPAGGEGRANTQKPQ